MLAEQRKLATPVEGETAEDVGRVSHHKLDVAAYSVERMAGLASVVVLELLAGDLTWIAKYILDHLDCIFD